jgi:hypothetical protein
MSDRPESINRYIRDYQSKPLTTGRLGGQQVRCRICGSETFTPVDLGMHPFANGLVESPNQSVERYPLALNVCSRCSAAQLSYCADDQELYEDYIFMTPNSTALRQHYISLYNFLEENGYLARPIDVLEIGSNVGYFLETIRSQARSVLGVDPALNIARIANERGIPTMPAFFNTDSAEIILRNEGKKNLLIARHVFAHNENPWHMLDGVRKLMTGNGTFVIENAYLPDTIRKHEFDQIYHEHMYYYNIRAIQEIVQKGGMRLIDVMHANVHGGSMAYIVKWASAYEQPTERLREYLAQETLMHTPQYYEDFRQQLRRNRSELRALIRGLRAEGKTIHAYGASAKSTTLFNYFGITSEEIPVVVDSTPTKIGKYIPGANIRIISENEARNNRPDYYLLTIWNYKNEIVRKVRSWGDTQSQFILPHPKVEVVSNE